MIVSEAIVYFLVGALCTILSVILTYLITVIVDRYCPCLNTSADPELVRARREAEAAVAAREAKKKAVSQIERKKLIQEKMNTMIHSTEKSKELTDRIPKDTVCSICLADYADGDKLMYKDCDHFFHEECLTAWLLEHEVCPFCRETMLTIEDFEKILNTNNNNGDVESPQQEQQQHNDNSDPTISVTTTDNNNNDSTNNDVTTTGTTDLGDSDIEMQQSEAIEEDEHDSSSETQASNNLVVPTISVS